MPNPKITKNRHLVDRYADLCEQIKELESQKEALRADIIATDDRVGDEWMADVKTQIQHRLDRPYLEDRFGKETIAECCKETTVTFVKTYRLSGKGPSRRSEQAPWLR